MNIPEIDRRNFLRLSLLAGAGLAFPAFSAGVAAKWDGKLSLSEYSFFEGLSRGRIAHHQFPSFAAKLGFSGVEYGSEFFSLNKNNKNELAELRKISRNEGVENVLIRCFGEGMLGHPDKGQRHRAVENHKRWIEAAAQLGCKAIRVNAGSRGSYGDQVRFATDGLSELVAFARMAKLDVWVENGVGLSSESRWLLEVMNRVGDKRIRLTLHLGLLGGRQNVEKMGIKQLLPFMESVTFPFGFWRSVVGLNEDELAFLCRILADSAYRGRVAIESHSSSDREEEQLIEAKGRLEKAMRQAWR